MSFYSLNSLFAFHKWKYVRLNRMMFHSLSTKRKVNVFYPNTNNTYQPYTVTTEWRYFECWLDMCACNLLYFSYFGMTFYCRAHKLIHSGSIVFLGTPVHWLVSYKMHRGELLIQFLYDRKKYNLVFYQDTWLSVQTLIFAPGPLWHDGIPMMGERMHINAKYIKYSTKVAAVKSAQLKLFIDIHHIT